MLLDLSKPYDQEKAKIYFKKLILSNSKIELRKIQGIRSLDVNAYLHVCISLYAVEFGYSLNEAKTDLKRMCHFMVYKKNGKKYLRETSKMTNKELSEFIEWIRNLSAKNGLYIPTAEEYKNNKFNIDKEINKFKNYL